MLNLNSPRILDSTGALKLEKVPASLLVVGGGYIGLEMGTVYAALGSKVTVVELTPSLLPGVDADLVRPLHARLKPLFENIYLRTFGQAKYQALTAHTIKWTDPSVKTALKTMADIVGNSGNVAGGTTGAPKAATRADRLGS